MCRRFCARCHPAFGGKSKSLLRENAATSAPNKREGEREGEREPVASIGVPAHADNTQLAFGITKLEQVGMAIGEKCSISAIGLLSHQSEDLGQLHCSVFAKLVEDLVSSSVSFKFVILEFSLFGLVFHEVVKPHEEVVPDEANLDDRGVARVQLEVVGNDELRLGIQLHNAEGGKNALRHNLCFATSKLGEGPKGFLSCTENINVVWFYSLFRERYRELRHQSSAEIRRLSHKAILSMDARFSGHLPVSRESLKEQQLYNTIYFGTGQWLY